MTAVAGDAFGAALRDGRAEFNRRFEQARHRFPQLSGAEVLDFLRENVAQSSGRTYAGGLTKFEPKELERIAVPRLEELANSSARVASPLPLVSAPAPG